MSDDDGTLHLDRQIRVPTSISEQAQAALRAAVPIVHERLANPEVSPPLDDAEAWRARNAATDAHIVSMFEGRAPDVDWELREIAGVPVFEIRPDGADLSDDGPILYDIHGGALVAGGGEACRLMASGAALRSGLRTFAIDYRIAPDHPYPAALDDCIAVYRALLERFPAERIVVDGASAGGNLVAALLVRAHDEGLPKPAAAMMFTPELDLTESGDTFDVLHGVDVILVQRLTDTIALYANGHDLTHPYLSPLFADVSHFPPSFIQAGTRDLFLSNAVRMHRKLRTANVDAELHVWEAMPHGGFGGAPEDVEMVIEVRKFLAKHLG
ncbi:MAG: alpha/beta hydrolase [Acidimicrobiia bacterium]